MQERSIKDSAPCILRISVRDMIRLGVRTRGSKERELPEVLYQAFPLQGMSLLATLPQDAGAVSIPQESDWRGGYRIDTVVPEVADGFVMEYARRWNGCYEAAGVRYQDSKWDMAAFVGMARRWTEERFGPLRAIPGLYACHAPDREEWESILRDHGYVAWNPGAASRNCQALTDSVFSPTGNAIGVRVPLWAGNTPQHAAAVPAFSRVEVMPEPGFGMASAWMQFQEYIDGRAARSGFPESLVPGVLDWLGRLARASGFQYWLFRPGMLAGDAAEWWGDRCLRRSVHEGLDFAAGIREGVGVCAISEGLEVCSIADGEVVAVMDDFIGKTVAVRHASVAHADGAVLYTLFSHLQPATRGLGPVSRGDSLGKVGRRAAALTAALTAARAPAHLHLTCAWIPGDFSARELSMDSIHPGNARTRLINLNSLVARSPLCRIDATA